MTGLTKTEIDDLGRADLQSLLRLRTRILADLEIVSPLQDPDKVQKLTIAVERVQHAIEALDREVVDDTAQRIQVFWDDDMTAAFLDQHIGPCPARFPA
jgi:hypothetical protein